LSLGLELLLFGLQLFLSLKLLLLGFELLCLHLLELLNLKLLGFELLLGLELCWVLLRGWWLLVWLLTNSPITPIVVILVLLNNANLLLDNRWR
jgi:hypothetical protein